MTRVRLQSVHLRLLEDVTMLDFTLSPVVIANGNVQREGVAEAVAVSFQEVKLKHYMRKPNSGIYCRKSWFCVARRTFAFASACVDKSMHDLKSVDTQYI